jgi:hypothetical protein
MRVLEHCGFIREGISRASVFKDGEIIDRMVYAFVNEGARQVGQAQQRRAFPRRCARAPGRR